MEKTLMVGLGGFLGSVLRFGLAGVVARLKGGTVFPLETLVINVIGCLAIGVLAGLHETCGLFGGVAGAFLFVGLLGGFTTYSAFGLETFRLLRDGQWPAAALSVGLQVVVGIGAVAAGYAVVRGMGSA